MFYALKSYNNLERLRTWLNNKLCEYKKRTGLPFKKIIMKLSDIQLLHSKNETQYLKDLTKEQGKNFGNICRNS